MIIAVDAAGGDFAPHEIVKGCIKAIQDFDVDIALVGKKSLLHVMAGRHLKSSRLNVVEASEVIGSDEHPVQAIQNKPDSTIVVGLKLLKEGQASAFVSAGNTGALFIGSLLILGKIEGVERPAICGILDITHTSPVLLLDAGANAECKPAYLVQFGKMGTIFAERVLGIKTPRVGLLNNGSEETKGNRLALESYGLLKSSNLNFIGNVEGSDITKNKADVIVTDGFTGNIVLKTIEGLGDSVQVQVGQLDQSSIDTLHGRALNDIVEFNSWAKKMDYEEYGGGCIIGVNGNIIKAHGRSRAKAIRNAIGLAKQTAESDIAKIIQEGSNGQAN